MDLNELRSEGDLNISPLRAQWARDNIDAETQAWLDEDAKFFVHQSLSTPCLDVLRDLFLATLLWKEGDLDRILTSKQIDGATILVEPHHVRHEGAKVESPFRKTIECILGGLARMRLRAREG